MEDQGEEESQESGGSSGGSGWKGVYQRSQASLWIPMRRRERNGPKKVTLSHSFYYDLPPDNKDDSPKDESPSESAHNKGPQENQMESGEGGRFCVTSSSGWIPIRHKNDGKGVESLKIR